jgi:hypothetical protein
MYKYCDIERLGTPENEGMFNINEDTIEISEKVDGGNGSFWIDDKDNLIHFGSRNRDLTLENDTKMFAGFQLQLREHLKDKKLHPDYIYYIEWMAIHTIHYTKAPFVIGFDIRIKRSMNKEGEGLFLARESREKEFERLGIENCPLIWRGTVKELKELNIRDLIPKSKYFDGYAEGIVIKNYNRKHPYNNYQLYAKLVRDEFKEDNKAIFGSVKQKISDSSRIISTYCTDARIRKAVLQFVDNGDKLNLRLMSKVPHYIIKDIFKEEIIEIIDNYKFIDIKEIRSKIPKLCLRVINEMMIELSKYDGELK